MLKNLGILFFGISSSIKEWSWRCYYLSECEESLREVRLMSHQTDYSILVSHSWLMLSRTEHSLLLFGLHDSFNLSWQWTANLLKLSGYYLISLLYVPRLKVPGEPLYVEKSNGITVIIDNMRFLMLINDELIREL